ncbi:MAG: 16S rRNA (cytidine(1402)-2'-O)-methyltransferase [bacterium]
MTDMPGKLYLVPTPIGNMSDISRRAITVLSEVDLVACEDTRHSGHLLKELGIQKPLVAYHEFNERSRAQKLVEQILAGRSIAVISDAGSPGISDPAYRVVRSALDAAIEVVALPGPCAIIPALTASGLPTDRFFFEGFLPVKSAARQRRLAELAGFEHTLVFYESPHRVFKSLVDMHQVLGNRPACLAREISKKFEQFVRMNLGEMSQLYSDRKVKGEIVIVVAGTGLMRKTEAQDE